MQGRHLSQLVIGLMVIAALAVAAGSTATSGSGPQPQRSWKPVTLVYLSDVKGKIEHCGCASHPRGGLARRAAFMDNVWAENKPLLNLDAGDVFGPRTQNDREQTKFLCQELGNFGLDAIGLGEQDLNFGLDFLREMISTNKLPFISANVRDVGSGKLILPAYKVVERDGVKYGIVSVLDPQQQILTLTGGEGPVTVDDPLVALRQLLPELRRNSDTVVLLSHLGESGTEALLKELPGVDICIVGHTYRNIDTERIINDTAVFGSAYEGRFIGRANLFVEETSGRVMAIDVGITDFDDKAPEDAEVQGRVDKFKTDLVAFQNAKRAAYPRINGSKAEQFVGERTCFTCHEAAWQSYAASAHRRAYASLRSDGQSNEPDCLVCHTTGYQWQNGYSDERPYNALVNVQCEACHGYGSTHARDGKWRLAARSSCVTCHDQKNSPNFDYATYWEKIKH